MGNVTRILPYICAFCPDEQWFSAYQIYDELKYIDESFRFQAIANHLRRMADEGYLEVNVASKNAPNRFTRVNSYFIKKPLYGYIKAKEDGVLQCKQNIDEARARKRQDKALPLLTIRLGNELYFSRGRGE